MKKIQLTNETYNVLKWICIIVLPAVGCCISGLGLIWEWGPVTAKIVETLGVIEVLLGSLLGISCYNYNQQKGD